MGFGLTTICPLAMVLRGTDFGSISFVSSRSPSLILTAGLLTMATGFGLLACHPMPTPHMADIAHAMAAERKLTILLVPRKKIYDAAENERSPCDKAKNWRYEQGKQKAL